MYLQAIARIIIIAKVYDTFWNQIPVVPVFLHNSDLEVTVWCKVNMGIVHFHSRHFISFNTIYSLWSVLRESFNFVMYLFTNHDGHLIQLSMSNKKNKNELTNK